MHRKVIVLSASGWLIGAGLLAATVGGYPPDRLTAGFLNRAPSHSAVAQAPREAPTQPFTREAALTAATRLADSKLSETFGSAHNQDGVTVAAVLLEGRAISLGDLQLKEFRFAAGVTAVTTRYGTSSEFPYRVDVWVAVWQRAGVPAPDWDNVSSTVQVVVEMEDRTGRILSAAISRFPTE